MNYLLCAAVLAVEIAQTAQDHIDTEFHVVKYFSDSRAVLGYIHNDTRRFFVYVSNIVEKKKRNLSLPKQWSYIPISLNPADVGTRMLSPKDLQKCAWLNGPSSFLAKIPHTNTHKW